MSSWLDSVISGQTSKPEPTPRSDVKHIELLGHPSQGYARTRMAECGHYYHVRDFATNVDEVTCPKCLARLDAREAMEI